MAANNERTGPPCGTRQRIPEEYTPGDIVYTADGTMYELLACGDQGYGARIRYLEGPKAGQENYIAEVNWLFR